MKLILFFLWQFSIASALVFNCSFYKTSWYSIGSLYTCYAKVINTESSFTLEGEHVETFNNFDTKSLYIKDQNIQRFPKNLASFLPSLKVISCLKSGLVEISVDDLKPFSDLEYLSLANNNLVKIPGDLFKFTLKLRGIILARNKLQQVGNHLLENLQFLDFVDVQTNPCINGYAQSQAGYFALNYEMPMKCPYKDDETLRCSLPEEISNLHEKITEIEENLMKMELEIEELKKDNTRTK